MLKKRLLKEKQKWKTVQIRIHKFTVKNKMKKRKTVQIRIRKFIERK
jgi:hypothetical protein